MARARADDVTADMTRERRRRSDGESAAAPHPSHPLATPPRSDTTTRRSRTLFAERPRGLDRDAAHCSRFRRHHRDRDRDVLRKTARFNREESRVKTRGSRGGQVVKSTVVRHPSGEGPRTMPRGRGGHPHIHLKDTSAPNHPHFTLIGLLPVDEVVEEPAGTPPREAAGRVGGRVAPAAPWARPRSKRKPARSPGRGSRARAWLLASRSRENSATSAKRTPSKHTFKDFRCLSF